MKYSDHYITVRGEETDSGLPPRRWIITLEQPTGSNMVSISMDRDHAVRLATLLSEQLDINVFISA